MNAIVQRKRSHLELCATQDVEGGRSTLLEQVHLFHEALPEIGCDEVDLGVDVLGHRLRAPFVIAGMSGGAAEARELNRALARTAQEFGLGMGVGSQRAMLLDPSTAPTYRVRDVAPDILLLANIGAVQAREAGTRRVADLAAAIEADALCIHLNAAQELVQDDGDRDFRGCLETVARLVAELPVPVIVKETGCGFGPATLARLHAVGLRYVDVSGVGGTTWPGVEALRGSARQRALGTDLRDWGVPTAAAVVYARRCGLLTIASGGVRGATDAARALALGAEVVSLALPFLRAYKAGGLAAARETAARLTEGLRAVLVLTGARRVRDLRRVPRVLGPDLRAWLAAGNAISRPSAQTGAKPQRERVAMHASRNDG